MTENVLSGNSVSAAVSDALPSIASIQCSQTETKQDKDAQTFTISPSPNRFAPLLGKNIFMHYDPGTIPDRNIEKILRKLKANILDFFNRDVHYIITNRQLSRTPQSSSRPIKGTPAPPPHRPTALSQTQHDSSSPGLKPPIISFPKSSSGIVSRGRAMLMAAYRGTSTVAKVSPTSRASISPMSVLRQLQNKENLQPSPDIATSYSEKQPDITPSHEKACTNDLLAHAKRLGIRILTIDAVLKWICNLPSDVRAYIDSTELVDDCDLGLPEDPERDRIHQVRHLIPPCLKIIDLSGTSRPLYMDRTDYLPGLWNWPNKFAATLPITAAHPNSLAGVSGVGLLPASPGLYLSQSRSHPATQMTGTFPVPVLSRQTSRQKRKDAKESRQQRRKSREEHPLQRSTSVPGKSLQASVKAQTTINEVNEEPSGYCECCATNFPNLYEHLQCDDHQRFATNNENYRILDDVLNKMPTIEAFLTATAKRRQHSNEARKRRRRSGSNREADKTLEQPKSKRHCGDCSSAKPAEVDQPVVAAEQIVITSLPSLSIPTLKPNEQNAQPVQLFSDDDESILATPAVNIQLSEHPIGAHPSTSQPESAVNCPAVPDVHMVCEPPLQEALPAANDHEHFVPCETTHPGMVNTFPVSKPRIICPRYLQSNEIVMSTTLQRIDASSANSRETDESPILRNIHSRCGVCHRVHIPAKGSRITHLQLSTLFGLTQGLDGFGCSGQSVGEHQDSPVSHDDEDVVKPESNAHSPVFEPSVFEDSLSVRCPVVHQEQATELDTAVSYSAHGQINETSEKRDIHGGNSGAGSTDPSSAEEAVEDRFFSSLPIARSESLPKRSSLQSLFERSSGDSSHADDVKSLSIERRSLTRKRNLPEERSPVQRRRRRVEKSETLLPQSPSPRDRHSRVAARVARESISLSIRALYSPQTIDRLPRGMGTSPSDTEPHRYRVHSVRPKTKRKTLRNFNLFPSPTGSES